MTGFLNFINSVSPQTAMLLGVGFACCIKFYMQHLEGKKIEAEKLQLNRNVERNRFLRVEEAGKSSV